MVGEELLTLTQTLTLTPPQANFSLSKISPKSSSSPSLLLPPLSYNPYKKKKKSIIKMNKSVEQELSLSRS